MKRTSKDNTFPGPAPSRATLAAWLLLMVTIPLLAATMIASFDVQAQMDAEPLPTETNPSTPTPTSTPTATPTETSTPYYVCDWVFDG